MYAVAVGSGFSPQGITLYGPFNDEDTAWDWGFANNVGEDAYWCVTEVVPATNY